MSNNTEHNRMIEELYIEMYTKLLIYARSALGDLHLAEEAVQDTFRIACAKSEQLGQSNNREGWLTNTLKHVIYVMKLLERREKEENTSNIEKAGATLAYAPAIYIYFDVHLDAVEVCTVGVLVVAAAQVHIVYRLAPRVFYAHRAGGVLPACGVKKEQIGVCLSALGG